MAKKSNCLVKTKRKRACLAEVKQRRVLYIITKSVWGGAAKYVYDLSSHLPKDKFNIAVAAGRNGEFAQRIIESHIHYFEIKNFQRKVHLLKEPLAVLEILQLIFKFKPDIIHVNSSKAGGIVGLASFIYKILHRTQTVFTAHGWAFEEDRPKWQLFSIKFFSKITALFYNKIICVSIHDRNIAIKNKIAPDHKLITIHNGIDIKSIDFLSKEKAQRNLLQGKTSPLVIGTIAEWTKNKGLFYLLEAIIKVNSLNSKNFDIILIGSGENPDKEKILAFIKKNNLKNIYLHEWIPDVASYFKAFDVFVLPSVKEGLPYTILEAMTAEVPTITTNVGGIPEMIENNTSGILIPSKNSQMLAEKIIELMDNPDLGKKMAQKAKEKVTKEFGLKKMIEETKRVYALGSRTVL